MSGGVKTAQPNQRLTVGSQATAPSGGAGNALTAFSPTGYLPSAGILVQASLGNTGTIYVGDSDVAANKCAAELAAGNSILIPVCDPTKIYVLGSVASQKVNYSGA